MFIKPTSSELKVFDPIRKDILPLDGREVEPSPYWTRRFADGDIISCASEQEEVVAKPVVKGANK
jgi:hypothetical protein